MAEAVLNRAGQGNFRAFSAGSKPKGQVHPYTLDLLRKLNYDVSNVRSKSWLEFSQPDSPKLDFVFTVCDNATGETCPYWPGQPMTAHWGVPDPAAATGNEAEIRFAFADTLRMLTNRINIFVSLPLAKLDHLSLQKSLDEIGKTKGAESPATAAEWIAECPYFGGWWQRVLGTAILVATVVGSGIMAEQLAGGNQAIALLGNTIPTGAILIVIITIFGPVSGAHFNPAVTLVFAARGDTPWVEVIPYIVVQCVGAILGTVLAHLMFELAPLVIGIKERSGPSQWLAEAVATFTLVITIFGGLRYAPTAIPWLVGLVITAAYWFTASTSFANPAVTLARGFTTTFAGIAINHVPAFVIAQLVGAAVGLSVSATLFPSLARGSAKALAPGE
jgi:glycerol uptake facilitator-like aquaporin/protein-tyrosine-phosphatase